LERALKTGRPRILNDLERDEFELVPRGVRELKGLGFVEAWLVRGRRHEHEHAEAAPVDGEEPRQRLPFHSALQSGSTVDFRSERVIQASSPPSPVTVVSGIKGAALASLRMTPSVELVVSWAPRCT
jgi:hypothetical protein